MNLAEAMQWADTFGPIQDDPPDGDAPALMLLAAEVRRLVAYVRELEDSHSKEAAPLVVEIERLRDALCEIAKADMTIRGFHMMANAALDA